MHEQHEAIPPADLNASSLVLREYFSQILPEHDRDKVHINDIKKCIKWYNFMRENGILEEARREAEALKAKEAETQENTENTEQTSDSEEKSSEQ
jgi:hypothetical protein